MLNKVMIGAKKFNWTWNYLRMRTTSRSKDFPTIFACLLGLDTTQILKEPEEKRIIILIF